MDSSLSHPADLCSSSTGRTPAPPAPPAPPAARGRRPPQDVRGWGSGGRVGLLQNTHSTGRPRCRQTSPPPSQVPTPTFVNRLKDFNVGKDGKLPFKINTRKILLDLFNGLISSCLQVEMVFGALKGTNRLPEVIFIILDRFGPRYRCWTFLFPPVTWNNYS